MLAGHPRHAHSRAPRRQRTPHAAQATARAAPPPPPPPSHPHPHPPLAPCPRSYLSWDDYFMALAFLSAQRSKDPNKQVCVGGGGGGEAAGEAGGPGPARTPRRSGRPGAKPSLAARAAGSAVATGAAAGSEREPWPGPGPARRRPGAALPQARAQLRAAAARWAQLLTAAHAPPRQVGACIVSQDNIILGIGYNGFPRGCADGQLPWAKKHRGGDQLATKYPYVVHAEANALLNKNAAVVEGAVRCRRRGPLQCLASFFGGGRLAAGGGPVQLGRGGGGGAGGRRPWGIRPGCRHHRHRHHHPVCQWLRMAVDGCW
jgi:deoxycytidylate deaminase